MITNSAEVNVTAYMGVLLSLPQNDGTTKEVLLKEGVPITSLLYKNGELINISGRLKVINFAYTKRQKSPDCIHETGTIFDKEFVPTNIIVDCSTPMHSDVRAIPLSLIRDIELEQDEEELLVPLPDDAPNTSSVFKMSYSTEASKQAVKALMNDIINYQENAPIFTSTLPEGAGFAEFNGVYNLEATPGERTLASPNKIENPYVSGAVVLHYNEANDTWETVDSEIEDGWVYATFDSFSPVAVYLTYKKPYFVTRGNQTWYVANGIPITIQEIDGITYASRFDGNVRDELPTNVSIVGGTYDEASHLSETSIVMESGIVRNVTSGSVNFGEGQAIVDHAKFVMNGGQVTNCIAGGIYKVVLGTSEVELNGGTITYAGAGVQTYYDRESGDCNTSTPDENSMSHVDYALLTVNDAVGNGAYIYTGGTSGYGYIKNGETVINGGTFEEVLGPSNGVVDNLRITVTGGSIGKLSTINRGTIHNAALDVTGGTIGKVFLGGNADDGTVVGDIKNTQATIKGVTTSIHAGTSGGAPISASSNKIISVTIEDASTNITYLDNFDTEFANVIHHI